VRRWKQDSLIRISSASGCSMSRRCEKSWCTVIRTEL